MMKIPKTLQQILKDAPITWGILALHDYRTGKKSIAMLLTEWLTYKNRKHVDKRRS